MSWQEVAEHLRCGEMRRSPKSYVLGTILDYWAHRSGQVPRERGAAQLVLEDGFLVGYGAFEDHDIHNDAREDNVETWLSGDVFELFFQVRGHRDYYEAHVTPEGYRLQLHIQSWQTIREESWSSKLCDFGLVGRSEIRRQEHLWLCSLRIPCSGIGLCPDLLSGSKFAFARYSYTHGLSKPEISSTQVFPSTCHFVPLWHELQG